MSPSGPLISSLPDRSAIKDNRPFRKRPKSCDEVLTQLNSENMYIPPSDLPKTTSTAPREYRCLCAPTTHAGSFRCRLHRDSFQKQSASNEPRLPPSLQILLPSSARRIVTLKAADSKLSRLSKMATCSQMDCKPFPTEETVNGPPWTMSEPYI